MDNRNRRTAIVLVKNNIESIFIVDITKNVCEQLLLNYGILLTPSTCKYREVEMF